MSNEQPIQSAVDRRAAEAHLRTLITKFAPENLKVITAARRRLRTLLPTAHEVVYEYRSWFVISYSPSDRGYEGVLAIRADAAGVKLYFNQGKDLPDPEKLLQGSSQARSVALESAATLSRPAVACLIDEALVRNPVPFAQAGRGTVTIRSSSSKPRPRRPSKRVAAPARAVRAKSRKKSK